MPVDQNDAFSPAPPFAPSDPPSILQEQQVGSAAWQNLKLIREQQEFEAKIARAVARSRIGISNQIEAGSSAFDVNVTAREFTDPETGEKRTFRVVTTTDNPNAEADAKLLKDYEEAVARGTATPYRQRPSDAQAHAVERLTDAERAKRDAAMPPPTIVSVPLPEAYKITPAEAMQLARERLADAGADLRIGSVRIYDNPVAFGQIAEWRQDEGHAAPEPETRP
jgi:hypothetical protein